MKSKSTYSKEFVPKDPKKDDYSYISDQLKTGYRWLGKTTYGDFFNNPNPEYFAKKAKIVEKKEDNPNFNRQYCKLSLTQKLFTRTILFLRKIPFAPRKSLLRPKRKALSTIVKLTFQRIVTLKHSHQTSMPYLLQNTHMSDRQIRL